MPDQQSFKNHTRREPLYLSLVAVLGANFVLMVVRAVRHYRHNGHLILWPIVMSIVFVLIVMMVRVYSLKVQDRVIRLEERLRLQSLANESELAELDSLTVRQYVALRFASNPEVVELARRAVRENLTGKQIKENIRSWRPDEHRV
jgi:predicted membrane protein